MHEILHILGLCGDSSSHFDLYDFLFLQSPEMQMMRFTVKEKLVYLFKIISM